MTDQNLNNFFDIISKNRPRVFGIVLASILVSVIYALNATVLYKNSIYITPPSLENISALNITNKDGRKLVAMENEIKVNGVYTLFMVNAQSRKLQREYFFNNEIYKYFDNDDFELSFEDFHKNLSFRLQSKVLSREVRYESFMTVSLVHPNSEEAAKILNEYIEYVINKTSLELVNGVNKLIQQKRDTVVSEISSKILLANQITQDRITQLEEALIIAKKLSIEEISFTGASQQNVVISDTNLFNNNQPLYLFGTRALKVEINTLKKRSSEEPFISGLRQLQVKASSLSSIVIDPTEVRAAQIDQQAIPTDKRFAPKRKLIVFLGAVFGVFLSLIYIFYKSIFLIRRSN